MDTLLALKSTFPDDEYGLMVEYLYARGPRGPKLAERFAESCKSDALVFGRDLLALASEHREAE